MDGFTDQPAGDGAPVNLIHLRSHGGFEVVFMDWGATWLSCRVPLHRAAAATAPSTDPMRREVLLRSPDLSRHLQQRAYFGATIGRYANRIAGGGFTLPTDHPALGSTRYVHLNTNEGNNTLHGGSQGFDSRRWEIAEHSDSAVTFALVSPAGDQGFPGRLQVHARYQLVEQNSLLASFSATTDALTPVNLTNHAYFNLAAEQEQILDHTLQIRADQFLPVDSAGIPAEGLKALAGTSFDFRRPKKIGRDLLQDADQRLVGGYDHSFLLRRETAALTSPAATLIAPDARLRLDILTNKPALQLYAGNHLADVPGADGRNYRVHSGVALETQFLPDAPNHPQWPHASSLLQPGKTYSYQTLFRFSAPEQADA